VSGPPAASMESTAEVMVGRGVVAASQQPLRGERDWWVNKQRGKLHDPSSGCQQVDDSCFAPSNNWARLVLAVAASSPASH
jgi:hypothetical protein